MIRLTTRQAEYVRLDFQVNAERALDELTGISPTCSRRRPAGRLHA